MVEEIHDGGKLPVLGSYSPPIPYLAEMPKACWRAYKNTQKWAL